MKKPSGPGKRKAEIALASTLAMLAIFLAAGVQIEKAKGTCYTETRVCHGVPIGKTCIGVETLKKDFVPAGQCPSLERIQTSCREAQRSLCGQGDWRAAVVDGFSCGFWQQKYDEIDLKTCESINQTGE